MSVSEYFNGLYGNKTLISYLSYSIENSGLPHALIFEGPCGSGKKTAARMTCAALCPAYADKIMRNITPDVTFHFPEDNRKTIGVATIREIKENAFIFPQELNMRVFIIAKADAMTVEAQNALLKILEEPPSDVYFFLLSENSSALLPTVRSRAPVVRMEIFEEEELKDYIIAHNPKAEKLAKKDDGSLELAIRNSEGTIGQLTEKLGSTKDAAIKIRTKTDELLELLAKGKDSDTVIYMAKAGLEREELADLMLNISFAARDMLALKYGSEVRMLYFLNTEKAEEFSSEFPKINLMKLYEAAEKMREYLNANVNVQLFSLRAANMLTEALK